MKNFLRKNQKVRLKQNSDLYTKTSEGTGYVYQPYNVDTIFRFKRSTYRRLFFVHDLDPTVIEIFIAKREFSIFFSLSFIDDKSCFYEWS
jgi:hypothetical protein